MELMPIGCIRLRVKLSLQSVVRQAAAQESVGFVTGVLLNSLDSEKLVHQDLPVPKLIALKDS